MARTPRRDDDRSTDGADQFDDSRAFDDRETRDVTNDEIAIRAYELYEARGGEHGQDWDDWLEAERELMRRRGGPGPVPS